MTANAATLELVRVWGDDRGRVTGATPRLVLTDDPGAVLALTSAGVTRLDAGTGERVSNAPWQGGVDVFNAVVASDRKGERVLVGTYRGDVLFVDALDGRVLRTLARLRGSITAASLSHRGEVAAVACAADGRSYAWETRTGRTLLQTREKAPIAVSPTGAWLAAWAAVGHGSAVRLTHLERGTRRALRIEGAARALCWSADERLLWAVTDAATAELWSLPHDDAAVERVARVSFLPTFAAAACAPDGALALLGARGEVWRLDRSGGTRVVAEGQGEAIGHAAISPDGSRAAWLRHENTLCVQDLATGRSLHHHAEHAGTITAATFSDDGALAATASNDRTVRVWRVDTGETLWVLEGATRTPVSVGFSPDRARVYASCAEGLVRAWSLDDGAELEPTDCPSPGDLRVSPDGERLVITHLEHRAPWLVDLRRGRASQLALGESQRVRCAGFGRDGAEVIALAASTDTDERTYALRYSARDGSSTVPSSTRIEVVLRELRGKAMPIGQYRSPALSHDGACVASVERIAADFVTVRDVGSSAAVSMISRRSRPAPCAPLALGATLLVVATHRGVEVWDVARAALGDEFDLGASQEHPVVVALSRDERHLLTATTLGRVHHHRIVR